MTYQYHDESIVKSLPENTVFVFGSNMAGLHAGGAARTALEHFGAVEGVGRGWSGQSYAIPTMNEHLQQMPLSQIQFNEEHGIVPRSAVRQVIKEIDTGEVLDDDQIDERISNQAKALSADERHLLADPKLFAKHMTKLEKEMLKASKELQFEQAARLRDEILRLKAQMLS
jgi:hypothetical protein